MLNVAFLDAVGWDYDVATPYERPMGGSQSALAYLAAELARRGSRVTLYTGTSRPGEVLGVSCASVHDIPAASFGQPFDAMVVLNGPADVGLTARPHLAPTTPLVLWTQHAHDQDAMRPLARPEVRQVWDAVACVSDWQRAALIAEYGLDPARVVVLRNAIAPAFEGLFADRDALARAKAARPVLGYTSTPFRGLGVLLSVFPEARAEFPDAELAVFSSMKVYQRDGAGDPFGPLYRLCRNTPGIRYEGAVSQPRLAEELKAASILAYPNTFAETSCIAVMEALAAGLLVVTTDLGALPETTMGFAALVPPADGPDGTEAFARDFLGRLKRVLRDRAADPSGFAADRFAQVEAINAGCTWRARAPHWEEAIRAWKHARAGSP